MVHHVSLGQLIALTLPVDHEDTVLIVGIARDAQLTASQDLADVTGPEDLEATVWDDDQPVVVVVSSPDPLARMRVRGWAELAFSEHQLVAGEVAGDRLTIRGQTHSLIELRRSCPPELVEQPTLLEQWAGEKFPRHFRPVEPVRPAGLDEAAAALADLERLVATGDLPDAELVARVAGVVTESRQRRDAALVHGIVADYVVSDDEGRIADAINIALTNADFRPRNLSQAPIRYLAWQYIADHTQGEQSHLVWSVAAMYAWMTGQARSAARAADCGLGIAEDSPICEMVDHAVRNGLTPKWVEARLRG